MKLLKFGLCLLFVGVAIAKPTTLGTPLGTATTPATPSTNVQKNPTALLRQNVHVIPSTHRIRGRVILATTHVEGSDQWGVTSEEAETSCHRIAQIQPDTIAAGEFQKTAKLSTENETKVPMEGHLISIGSSYEILALSRLLHPLPDGPFWTGGKVVRYRRHNSHDGSYTDHVILQWNDGRNADLSVLGMTKEDKLQLKEGYIYCLALNLLDNNWQARDCADKLPYACLVTPRRLRFSNEMRTGATKNETSDKTLENKSGSKSKKTQPDDDGKLMQKSIDQTHEDQVTTPISMTESQTETTPTPEMTTTSIVLSADAQATTPLTTEEIISTTESENEDDNSTMVTETVESVAKSAEEDDVGTVTETITSSTEGGQQEESLTPTAGGTLTQATTTVATLSEEVSEANTSTTETNTTTESEE